MLTPWIRGREEWGDLSGTALPTAWLNGTYPSSGPVSYILLLLSTAHPFLQKENTDCSELHKLKVDESGLEPKQRMQKPELLTTVILYPSESGHTPGKQRCYKTAEIGGGNLRTNKHMFLMWSMLGA